MDNKKKHSFSPQFFMLMLNIYFHKNHFNSSSEILRDIKRSKRILRSLDYDLNADSNWLNNKIF